MVDAIRPIVPCAIGALHAFGVTEGFPQQRIRRVLAVSLDESREGVPA